jgi:antitoxin ParD1/3/4
MPSSYTLGDHFEAFIREQLKAGRYASASEVIREGLRLLEETEERRQAELAGLRGARGAQVGPARGQPGRPARTSRA